MRKILFYLGRFFVSAKKTEIIMWISVKYLPIYSVTDMSTHKIQQAVKQQKLEYSFPVKPHRKIFV